MEPLCFVSAGIDTSRMTIRWALLHMAVYPEIQAKVQEEIDSVVGKYKVRYGPVRKNACLRGFRQNVVALCSY